MFPKHPRAQYFLKNNLFTGLSEFTQLEARIAGLSTTKDRGDAFEVFAEAYLATQRSTVQVKDVWPFQNIPLDVIQRFSLDTGNDMGVDGVIQTILGEYNAYQVKFRTRRTSLTWAELSTFMGLTDQVSKRFLFTNSDDLPALMDDRSRFFYIQGNDIDRLRAEDFQAVLEWLRSGAVTKHRKRPFSHQEEVLRAIQSAFEQQDRVTAVMACGTGKTLVGLWLAEHLQSRIVLVLLPSLALVRQTLHEWRPETVNSEVAYLCVCSDRTVTKGTDETVVRQSDLDSPVSTSSETVRQFLQCPFYGVRIILSTYQSAHLIAEAMPSGAAIDLAIFDEAHKTAGREGTRFSFALTDNHLTIRKRLFLTATPRHYDVERKDKEGNAKLVYSMDVPGVYGPVARTLSFAEAARRDIICGYKVIISVVTSDMVDADLLRRGEVIVEGDLIKATQVAHQLALREAVQKYKVRRIFTFHRSVASAKSFTAEGSEGIRTHLPDSDAFHVNGTMPTAKRGRIMKAFGDTKGKALISNARCLTEGIDVPAVDMVAFISPRKSRVDIVQAAGRAMRKAPDKTTGYVLVPLFLELAVGENLEEAIRRTGFDAVCDVLQALQEQDESLVEVIRHMREDKGRVGGYDDSRFREKVDILGPCISLETLRSAITAVCVDRLGVTWDERYGELVAYKERFGDCRVPYNWHDNPQLGSWVVVQRTNKRTGVLSEERIIRLNTIEFVWDAFDAYWEEQYTALLKFKEEHGDCDVPTRWDENRQLATWTDGQRQARKKRILEAARIARLDAIGFIWDLHEQYWDKMFSELLKFKQANGNCAVPDKWNKNRPLSTWVGNQRKKKAQLTEEQVMRLDEIGFLWAPKDTFWNEMFEKLVAYNITHGHCNIPQEWEKDKKLGNWVFNLRRAKRNGWLDERQISKLERIGFLWELPPYDAFWAKMYAALVEYNEAHGHYNPPLKCDENPQLGIWVGNQRNGRKKGKLSDDQIRQLNELGFSWAPRGDSWDSTYTLLVEYIKTHGHCNAPSDFPVLGRWVNKQRQAVKLGTLTQDRIERLNAIGFVWNILESSWNEMIDALADFKHFHGHCNVPQGWRDNPKLARWVNTQRMENKREVLSSDRVSRLDALGFVWNLRDQRSERPEAKME